VFGHPVVADVLVDDRDAGRLPSRPTVDPEPSVTELNALGTQPEHQPGGRFTTVTVPQRPSIGKGLITGAFRRSARAG
jgi:hypothetical protein